MADSLPAMPSQRHELRLNSINHVDANVNLTTLIEWLVDELASKVQSPRSKVERECPEFGLGLLTQTLDFGLWTYSPHTVTTTFLGPPWLRCSQR